MVKPGSDRVQQNIDHVPTCCVGGMSVMCQPDAGDTWHAMLASWRGRAAPSVAAGLDADPAACKPFMAPDIRISHMWLNDEVRGVYTQAAVSCMAMFCTAVHSASIVCELHMALAC
jgi:hypothetical protein